MEKLHPLRLERLKRSWTQYHVQFLSGVPQALISYAERGYPALNIKQRKKIAETFGLSEGELFPEKGEGYDVNRDH